MLNSRLFRLQQNQSRHFSTVLIRTNWYTISCKYNNCSSLTNITIPNSVTSIVSSAFSGTGFYANSPDGVFYVDKWACGYKGTMPSNTTISLQEGTVGIAASSFYGFRNLTNVTIPNSVMTIGIQAFSECSGLTSVTIPGSVTSIGNFAFSGCSGLTSVTIPGSVMDIGSSLFSRCSSLTSINVSVTDVSAFCNNTLLKSLNGIDSSKPFRLIDGEGNEIIELVIPSSVSSIGDYAFYGCSGLMSVTIPYFVTSIGVFAFFGCSGLTSVTVESDTPVSIYDRTFYPSQDNATLYVPYGSKADYESTDFWKDFKEIVEMKPKCDTPTITFANGRLTFDCETEGVEFKYYISMTGDQSDSGNEVLLPNMTPTYAVSVYATKEGYVNSDVATQVITYQPKMGDVNNDGDITIADAVAVVDLIMNAVPEPKFYYSVGTEEVTADNYTTANGAQYKSSLAEIPETLDLSAISQQQAVILLPERCMPVIRDASGLVGTTSVSLDNGHMVYTTTSTINGAECTCTVLK